MKQSQALERLQVCDHRLVGEMQVIANQAGSGREIHAIQIHDERHRAHERED